jgi:hypothetical protein
VTLLFQQLIPYCGHVFHHLPVSHACGRPPYFDTDLHMYDTNVISGRTTGESTCESIPSCRRRPRPDHVGVVKCPSVTAATMQVTGWGRWSRSDRDQITTDYFLVDHHKRERMLCSGVSILFIRQPLSDYILWYRSRRQPSS